VRTCRNATARPSSAPAKLRMSRSARRSASRSSTAAWRASRRQRRRAKPLPRILWRRCGCRLDGARRAGAGVVLLAQAILAQGAGERVATADRAIGIGLRLPRLGYRLALLDHAAPDGVIGRAAALARRWVRGPRLADARRLGLRDAAEKNHGQCNAQSVHFAQENEQYLVPVGRRLTLSGDSA